MEPSLSFDSPSARLRPQDAAIDTVAAKLTITTKDLADRRGQTADFSQMIIIMASNLGGREAIQRRTGFGTELAQAGPAAGQS